MFPVKILSWHICCKSKIPVQKYRLIGCGNLPVRKVVTLPVNCHHDAVCECRMKITNMSMKSYRTDVRSLLWANHKISMEMQWLLHSVCSNRRCFTIVYYVNICTRWKSLTTAPHLTSFSTCQAWDQAFFSINQRCGSAVGLCASCIFKSKS